MTGSIKFFLLVAIVMVVDLPASHAKMARSLLPSITTPVPQMLPEVWTNGTIDQVYIKKHQAQCEKVLAIKPELIFIGDSITARWPEELVKQNFGKYRYVNLGIGGDWVQNVLWRVLNGVLDQVHPKVIVLMVGTNNLFHRFTPDEIAEGVAAILKALHEKAPGSKVLVEGILPGGRSIKEPRNELIRQTNAKIALLADNKTVFYLDVGDKLLEPDGSITEAVMPDKLHVAMPGYVIWLEALTPTLTKLLETAGK